MSQDDAIHPSLIMQNERFVRRLGSFRETISEELKPSWLKLTTITMVSSHLRDQGIILDHEKLKKAFRKMGTITTNIIGCNKKAFNWQIFYGKTEFYNQITIGYKDELSTKKVKIFPNGSLQVAGCSDIADCRKFIEQLQVILMMVYSAHVPTSSFRVVMINSNFSLNHSINLMRVIDIFSQKNDDYKICFDPDRYSAVKMKFKPVSSGKQITTSIFASGSIIITGAENMSEVAEAYVQIVSTLLSQKDVYVDRNPTTKDFDYFEGYKYSSWFSKIMSDDSKNVV